MNNLLTNRELWYDIYTKTLDRNHWQRKKLATYKQIIETGEYLEIANSLLSGTYRFSIPQKKEINKFDSSKKKTVYLFKPKDDLVLKVINRLLTEQYSSIISPACHSFQQGKGAKSAFHSILRDKSLTSKYVFKTDIHNFFNSVNVNSFFELLPKEIKDNKLIFNILRNILTNEKVIYKGQVIADKNKGLMAGSPIAPFLSNIYLRHIDEYFTSQNITYARYSDDLIIFDTIENIHKHKSFITRELSKLNLQINQEKTHIFAPGEKWNFLGFSFHNYTIDIAQVSIDKLKRKIRRLSRRYNRKFEQGKFSEIQTLKYFINKINAKFYGKNLDTNDLCWTKWYFPLINTSYSLKLIDKFIQEKLRYSVCGRYSKLNYKKVPYNLLKELGYQPLTSSFYLFKNDFEKFNKIITNLQM